MKVLAVAVVCLVVITTTHGFGIGFPPFGGIHPFGAGIPPFGLGFPPLGLRIPPLGLGIPPIGLGIPSLGLGVSPLGLGSGHLNQGLVQTGSQGAGAVHSHSYGPGYIGELDANVAAAAPTTIAATAVAPVGPTAYDPAYMAI